MGTVVLAHGMGHMFTFFPFLMMGAAVYFIVIALRDESGKRPSTPVLPTDSLRRQVFVATRSQRRERSTASSQGRPARRSGGPSLQVMERDSGEGIPKTFV